jgi:pyruvate formate-lyase activating enzyme-like uncharacterized protein
MQAPDGSSSDVWKQLASEVLDMAMWFTEYAGADKDREKDAVLTLCKASARHALQLGERLQELEQQHRRQQEHYQEQEQRHRRQQEHYQEQEQRHQQLQEEVAELKAAVAVLQEQFRPQ